MRLGNGMEVEPWLKAAVRKEFVDDNRVKVNNEIAGLSSPSIPILTIRLFTQPGINILICVGGTALKCKWGGQIAMSSISKNTLGFCHNVDERDEKLKAEMTLP